MIINITKNSHIENLDISKYNFESFISTCEKICVGNGMFLYFNDDVKLDLYYIFKIIHPIIKNHWSVPFIEFTEMNWKTPGVNGLCISIFLNMMG